MHGYLLPLRCPSCGSEMVHVNSSKVTAGTECCAVADCTRCFRAYSVHVQLRPMPLQPAEIEARRRERRKVPA